jgi:hypothetical protein
MGLVQVAEKIDSGGAGCPAYFLLVQRKRLSLLKALSALMLVPRARLELARLSTADFESAASTDSATGACGGRIIPESLLSFK